MKLYKERREIKFGDGSDYMIRWYIFNSRNFSVKLHNILKSDHDCVHDHPWDFISIILKGGYIEHSEIPLNFSARSPYREIYLKVLEKEGYRINSIKNIEDFKEVVCVSKIISRFSIIKRKAEHRHKLEIHQPCWSLVFNFKVKRKWGFWDKVKGWIHWKQFDYTQTCD